MTNKTIDENAFIDSCRVVAGEIDTIVSYLHEEMKQRVFELDEETFKTTSIQNKYLTKLAQRIKNEAIIEQETTING